MYLAIPIVLGSLTSWVHPKKASWSEPETSQWELTLDSVGELGTNVIWVDARKQSAFELETIPGAIQLDHHNFESHLTQLFDLWTPESTIVVFCDQKFCDNSEEIAEKLRNEVGLPNVYFLKGGWSEWSQRNH